MDEHVEDRIRLRAYELWEQAGRPLGKHLDFWTQAETEAQPAKAAALDKGLEDTFPASDPASSTMRAPKND